MKDVIGKPLIKLALITVFAFALTFNPLNCLRSNINPFGVNSVVAAPCDDEAEQAEIEEEEFLMLISFMLIEAFKETGFGVEYTVPTENITKMNIIRPILYN